jgi:alpha-1,3/alpha-1,6-mannosyltransferase
LAESFGLKTATTKTIVTALIVPDDVEVLFLLSVPNTLKNMLLKSASLLIYTPSNEHFGIVPLEAMISGLPVLACNTGGPTETVVEGVTGWLRSPDQTAKWTEVMDRVLHKLSQKEIAAMSKAGQERVRDNFAETQMAERIDGILGGLEGSSGSMLGIGIVLGVFSIAAACVAVVFRALMNEKH